jgi:hypothetical protein
MNSLLTSAGLALAGLVAFSLVLGVDQSGFTAFWTGVVLLTLAVTARSVLQADFGAAVAWGYTAVFLALAPLLLALSLTRVASLWDPNSCSTPFEPCSPAPPGAWVPAILYAASLVFAWRAVRACKAERPQAVPDAGSQSPSEP